MEINLARFEPYLQIALVLVGAFLAASVISIVVWTARDIRSRSRDIFVQLLSILLVLVFNLPGLALYFILRPQETLADSYDRSLEEEALLRELEGRQACPYCHLRVEDDYLFCPGCHAQLRKTCTKCGRLMHLRWELCPYCGREEVKPPELVQPVSRAASAQRAIRAPSVPARLAVGSPAQRVVPVLDEPSDAIGDEETVTAYELTGLPEEEGPPLGEAVSAGADAPTDGPDVTDHQNHDPEVEDDAAPGPESLEPPETEEVVDDTESVATDRPAE